MNKDVQGLFLGLVAVVLFGMTLPATRLSVAEIDPVMIGIGRTIVAAAIAAVILAVTGAKRPGRADLPLLIAAAAGVVIGFPLFSAIALQWVPATHAGVVLAIMPLTTAIAGVAVAGERPSMGFWVCAVIGSLAVAVFALSQGGAELHIADLLLVLAVVCASAGYAAGGELSRKLGSWQVICWALVIALPVTVPVVLYILPGMNWGASQGAYAGFAYVALFSQLGGFFAWNRAMVLSGIARVGQLQLLQPFITIAGAALVLGEKVDAATVLFALAVVALVGLARRMRVERRGMPA